MNEIPFTRADIEANFDQRDLQRGRSYWRGGRVRDLTIEDGGMCLTAKVRGTRSEPYDVAIGIEPVPPRKKLQGSRFIFSAKCSCPVSLDCKHAAAVCFEALDRQGQPQKAKTPSAAFSITITDKDVSVQGIDGIIASLPPHLRVSIQNKIQKPAPDPLEKWLDDLAQPEQIQKKDSCNGCVLYILETPQPDRVHPQPHVVIRPFTTNILKSGDYGVVHDLSCYKLASTGDRHVTPEDTGIGKLMNGGHYGYASSFRSPPTEPDLFNLVLRRIIATGRCFLHDHHNEPLTLGEEKHAKLGWIANSDGVQVPAVIAHEDPTRLFILPAAQPWYVDIATRQAAPLNFDASFALVRKFLAGPKILPDAVEGLAERIAGRELAQVIEPPHAMQVEHRDYIIPTPCLRLTSYAAKVSHTTSMDYIERIHNLALLHFDYDGVEVDPNSAPYILRQQTGHRLITTQRQHKVEIDFVDRLVGEQGLAQTYSRPPNVPKSRLAYAFINGANDSMQWLNFLNNEVPKLRTEGWRIDVDGIFAKRFSAIEVDDSESAWDADLKEQEGGAWWFSLDLGIMVEGQRVALLPLLVQALKRLSEPTTQAIEGLALSGKLYVILPDGRTLSLPFERVRDILTTLVELYDQPLNPDGTMTVPLDLATALSRIDAATKMRWLGGKRLNALLKRLKSFSALATVPVPRSLKTTLRPYQREGLNWLQFLRDYGLGGILADDMGLGKTVQTLAHIMVEKEAKRLDRPCLIVCPTSVIPNWEDEAAKFAPKLKVLSLHGKDRATRYSGIENADLVLTTYPLLPRDASTLLPIEWHLVVLDEAQAIKNPATKATQLVCEIQTRHRLCLTGTPVENHLGEVWSQFAFLMPGMLGSHKDFTKRFRNPIEKQKDTERQTLLARRLKPFILRRNKSEVAKELPPKTEIIHHVEFESAQRDLYETVRLTMHEKVQEAVAGKGFNRSRIIILDALLKLRQACCDPRLVKLSGAKKVKQSAKLESLMGMLPEMIEEGRRILLFSQFTSMLDLIKPELDKAGIHFVEIRGDTTDRKTPVKRFQNCEVPVFLISLKAGGTGLNLTAADTVIHYDPWWNPAVENQATDRAHRIGQDKPVFVYKFIAKGTVEERILDLQNRKRNLAASLLDERPDATAAFTADDLDFLFRESE